MNWNSSRSSSSVIENKYRLIDWDCFEGQMTAGSLFYCQERNFFLESGQQFFFIFFYFLVFNHISTFLSVVVFYCRLLLSCHRDIAPFKRLLLLLRSNRKKKHFQIFQKPSGTWTQLSCKLKCTLENEKHLTETVCVMSGKSWLCQHVCPKQWFLNSSSTNWMIWTL